MWNTAIDADTAGNRFLGGALVTDGHRVFMGPDLGTVYAFDLATGKRLWRFGTAAVESNSVLPNFGRTNIVVGRCPPLLIGDVLIVGDGAGNVYALSAGDGSVRWKQGNIGTVWQFTVHGSDLFVASTRGFLQINPADGQVMREHTQPGGVFSFAIDHGYAILVNNVVKNPGWQLLRLDDWQVEREDNSLAVRYGLAASEDSIVIGGLIATNTAQGTSHAGVVSSNQHPAFHAVLRCYSDIWRAKGGDAISIVR